MIGVKVRVNTKKVRRSLTELRTTTSDLRPEMEIVRSMVKAAMIEHFDDFNRFIGTQSPKYRKNKPIDKVGVYTGDLSTAFHGGQGGIDKLESDYGVANAKYTWGIVPGAFQGRNKKGRFRTSYVKYFDGWLRQRGEKLVRLDDDKRAEILAAFSVALGARLRRNT